MGEWEGFSPSKTKKGLYWIFAVVKNDDGYEDTKVAPCWWDGKDILDVSTDTRIFFDEALFCFAISEPPPLPNCWD